MASSHAKSEPMDTAASAEAPDFDPVNLESEIIQLCLQFPNGVTDKILENSFRSVSIQQRVSALNRLLSLNKIDLLKSATEPGTFLYRIRDTTGTSGSSIAVGGDQMERVVYQLVKESGNLGIWMRDIRIKTKLSQTILNKTLKSLESKKLIKAVKSVHANKKKVR
jgi:DNA-directed RNA polymerase III subunit RPC6